MRLCHCPEGGIDWFDALDLSALFAAYPWRLAKLPTKTDASLPLDARQGGECFLTAAQSLIAVALLLRLRLSLVSAVVLLGLFLVQFSIGFAYQHDAPRTVQFLTGFALLYLTLAIGLLAASWRRFPGCVRVGLLNRMPARGGSSTVTSETDVRTQSRCDHSSAVRPMRPELGRMDVRHRRARIGPSYGQCGICGASPC